MYEVSVSQCVLYVCPRQVYNDDEGMKKCNRTTGIKSSG